MFRIGTLAVVVFFLVVGPAPAQTKRPITVEDLWKVQRLGKPSIAPDGKWVVTEVTTYSMEENNSTSDLWLLSTDGKTQKQLTTFKGKNSGPVWSPDGRWIAFISKRKGDVAQIHVISPAGGEARQVSNLPMAPSALKWGPNTETIYCIVNAWPETPDDDSYRKKEKAQKGDKVQAYIIDDALFRYWDHWIADGKRPVVFAADLASGNHRNLFTGLKLHLPVTNPGPETFAVSPDGKEICFTADTVKDIGTDVNLDLYAMPTDGSSPPRNLTADNPGSDHGPSYSPDGRHIAFLRQMTKFFYADRARVMLYDRAKNAVGAELTAKLDRSCQNLQWLAGGNAVVFEFEDKGYHRIGSEVLDPAKSYQWTKGYSDSSFALSSDGSTIAYLRTSFDLPAAMHMQTSADPTPRRIDHFNKELVSQWDFGEVKEVYYKGADDEDVQLWIVYPPGFDANKKWPLLMVVHGGPHNGITTDFHYRWNVHLQASKGYVVAIPNFHGSSGFGQKFTDSITGDMASKPFIDIMKATDYMEKQPYIDKNRMAAAGASYGGYMMAWLNGHTDRFKAMVCHAGVYNWHTQMASDMVRGRERALGAMPWGDIAKIDKQSPQRFAANFKTPTLVIHGEKDYRVPINHGFEYYNTLRLKGVPTRLVYFPDENHWVLKPQNSRLWHREFSAWLEKYIGSGPTRE